MRKQRKSKMGDYMNLFGSVRGSEKLKVRTKTSLCVCVCRLMLVMLRWLQDNLATMEQDAEDDSEVARETLKRLIAIDSYRAETVVELTFREGDVILLVEEHPSGW